MSNTVAVTKVEELCPVGHEFRIPSAELETEDRNGTIFVKGWTCQCGKVFGKVVQNKKGEVYVPEHHTQEWHVRQAELEKEIQTVEETKVETPKPKRNRTRKTVAAK
jgi:hypothetical protein